MMKIIGLMILFFFQTLHASLPTSPLASKRMVFTTLLVIYKENPLTFFCEQRFNSIGEITNLCKKCPTPLRIQWIPIVPAQKLAKHLPCFKHKLCINKQGFSFKGLRCCQTLDPTFRLASLDLHNFVPENSMIKLKHHFYAFDEPLSNDQNIKKCYFNINSKNKTIEVSPIKRGMIARTILYMRDLYQFPLSDKERDLYLRWHQQFPADAWERERNLKIKAIQGNLNPYIH